MTTISCLRARPERLDSAAGRAVAQKYPERPCASWSASAGGRPTSPRVPSGKTDRRLNGTFIVDNRSGAAAISRRYRGEGDARWIHHADGNSTIAIPVCS